MGALAQGGSGILGAIVEGTTDAVFAKDLEGRYLMINSAAARILSMPKGEIVGKDDAQLLPPETARRLAEADNRVMATGESSRLRGGAAGGWPIPHVPLD